MKNTANKYKILVLSDLKSTSKTILKSTIGLAQMIGGNIELFHVKKPTDVVEKENQLSAMRTINADYNNTQKKIRDLILPLSKKHGIKINQKLIFGNIKNEINDHIEASNPDIIILGKRKAKKISLMGDSITEFVMKKHKGVVMIASDKNAIEPSKGISLGILNNVKQSFNMAFADQLLDNVEHPPKAFRIMKGIDGLKEEQSLKGNKIVEYVFEQNDNAISTVSSYLKKNNINMFCMDRGKKNANRSVIDKLDVSLLITP